MVKKYNCQICNYITDRLSSYNKHLLTKKHIENETNKATIKLSRNEVATSINEGRTSKNEEILRKNQIKCNYCQKILYKSNKNRHYQACKEKEKYELEETMQKTKQDLEEKISILENKKLELDNRLKGEKQEIEKLKKRLRNEELCKLEIQKNYNEIIKMLIENGILGNNMINSHNKQTINQVYIMNNVNDACNFSDLMAPTLTNAEIKLISDEPVMLPFN